MTAMTRRVAKVAVALVAIGLLGLGTAVVGRSEDRASNRATHTVELASSDRVSLVTGGVVTALDTGSAIPIAGELTALAEIARDPNVRYVRSLTLQLAAGSRPVEGATITIAAHMLSMDHGSFNAVALASGNGRYVAELPFVMPGDWQLDIHVASSAGSGDLGIDIEEFD